MKAISPGTPLLYSLLVGGLRKGEENEARLAVHRFGFEVLDVQPIDRLTISATPRARMPDLLQGATHLVVAADLCPLDTEGRSWGKGAPFGNARLSLLRYAADLLHHLVAERRQTAGTQDASAVSRRSFRIDVVPDPFVNALLIEGLGSTQAHLLEERAKEMAASFVSPFPVEQVMPGIKYNAQVELVRVAGGVAVCKRFRPGRLDRFNNEFRALERLRSVSAAPDLLDAGDSWVLMSYCEGVELGQASKGLLPVRLVRGALESARTVHEAGVALLDYQPSNAIVQPDGRVRVIDFEGAYTYDMEPPPFRDSTFFQPVEAWEKLQIPPERLRNLETIYPRGTYEHRWRSRVGLPVESLLHESSWKWQVRRTAYVGRQFMARVQSRLARFATSDQGKADTE